tara:strand:- start:329 stop:814 length:486 start_codon:yes stop_codon:yes gene_type:complete
MSKLWTNEFIAEMVADIDEREDVMERHGVTADVLALWVKDPLFQAAYKEMKKFWQSNSNIRERITQKSLAALEDSLVGLFSIANDGSANPTARLDAVAKLAKLAKADGGEARETGANGAGGPSVMISINLDRDHHIEKSVSSESIVATVDTVPINQADTTQ